MQGLPRDYDWSPREDLADAPGVRLRAKVGRRIENRRLALGMSQCELARRTGIPQGTVSDIVRGDCGMRLDRLFVFAEALRTTPSKLLEGLR